MKLVRALVLAVAVAWSLGAAAGARVIDVSGTAERAGARGAGAVALFDALAVRDRLALNAGATATVLFDDTGRQFLLRGPGRWEVGTDALATLQGEPPRPLPQVAPALRPLALGRTRVAAGATAMRVSGVADLAPWPDAARLLAPPESLRWAAAGEGSRYKVTLATAEGQALFEGVAAASPLVLPAAARPRSGMGYAWSIEVDGGPRHGARAFAAFTVADEATQRHWSALRPAADAPVSQWVLYAHALDSAGFGDDARDAWRRVLEQRPDMRLLNPP